MNAGIFSSAAGIAVLAFMLVTGSFLVVMPGHAEAAFGGLTAFDIDGDLAGPNDWNDAATASRISAAVISDLCDDNGDDVLVPSTKLDDASWPTTNQKAVKKGDLCRVWTGSEQASNGDIILYFGWERLDVTGEVTVYVPLEGPLPGRTDDRLIKFEYDSSDKAVYPSILTWTGSAWGNETPLVAGQAEAAVSADTIFAEAAINLTTSGILPEGECRSFVGLQIITETGQANANPTLKDYVYLGGSGGFEFSSCGEVTVRKVTRPSPGLAGPFDFHLVGSDYEQHGTLAAGGSEFTYNDVEPGEYALTEDDPTAAGFSLTSITCDGVAVDASNPLLVEANTEHVCTITNTQLPANLTLIKRVITDDGGIRTAADFQAYIDGNPVPWGTSQVVLAGSHTASEATLPSYAAGPWGGDCRADGTIDLAPGQNATCTITNDDIPPSVTLLKNGDPSQLVEPGGAFDFTLTISNGSPFPVEITSLTDSQSGSAIDWANCTDLIGTILGVGGSTSCTYTVTHIEVGSYDNTASVTVTDEEGKDASDTADATVEVTDVLPTVTLVKDASPGSLPEPGGDFDFTLTITNTSVEPVEITDLTDSQSGATDFSGCSALIGTSLAAGASTSCTYTVAHSEAGVYDNTASVTVEDNEGNSASDTDDERVEVTDVLPTVTLVKDASPGSLPEPGGDFDFTLTIYNTSVEPVQVTALSDDYTLPVGCTGLVDQWIPVGGNLSCSYTVAHSEAGVYDNTASVTVEDNEGNPASDTDDETVTVTDTPIAISLQKTADPLFLSEPGGTFTYTLTITNPSHEAVTITELTDTNALSADCLDLIGETLSPAGDEGDSVSCTYAVERTAPGIYENVAAVVVVDNEENEASDDDDASVSVIDVPSSISVTKTPSVDQIPEPGGTVTFTVVVNNTSETDMLIVASLIDDIYGDLNGQGDCALPQKLAVGESYSCSFEGDVVGNAGDVHTNIVTVVAEDDDGNFIEDDDDATVTLTDVASAISVTKTADQAAVQEPGGTVTFTVVVSNLSAVDSLTITSIVDDVFGDLNGQGDCSVPQELALGASYTCAFEGEIVGEADSAADPHVNTVTVVGVDDDQNEVTDSDDETVDITDKPTGTIGDFVWNDTDEDGIQDDNEVGVEGVLVELVDAGTGEVIASQTTGADGAYEFSGIEEGDYFLRFTTPKSWEFGLVDEGDDDAVDSDAVFKSGDGEDEAHFEIAETLVFFLDVGETNTSFDAGMIKIIVSPQVITTTTTVPSTLPFTGFGTSDAAGTALVLVALGGFVLLAMRRREDEFEQPVPVHPAWDE